MPATGRMLSSSLLWARDFRTDLRARLESEAAPTWSCASAQCSVRPCDSIEVDGKAKVLEVKCEYLDDSEFGGVSSGCIVLRGRICRVRLPDDLPLLPDDLGNEDEDKEEDAENRENSDHYAHCRDESRCRSRYWGSLAYPLELATETREAQTDMVFSRIGRCNMPAEVVEKDTKV